MHNGANFPTSSNNEARGESPTTKHHSGGGNKVCFSLHTQVRAVATSARRSGLLNSRAAGETGKSAAPLLGTAARKAAEARRKQQAMSPTPARQNLTQRFSAAGRATTFKATERSRSGATAKASAARVEPDTARNVLSPREVMLSRSRQRSSTAQDVPTPPHVLYSSRGRSASAAVRNASHLSPRVTQDWGNGQSQLRSGSPGFVAQNTGRSNQASGVFRLSLTAANRSSSQQLSQTLKPPATSRRLSQTHRVVSTSRHSIPRDSHEISNSNNLYDRRFRTSTGAAAGKNSFGIRQNHNNYSSNNQSSPAVNTSMLQNTNAKSSMLRNSAQKLRQPASGNMNSSLSRSKTVISPAKNGTPAVISKPITASALQRRDKENQHKDPYYDDGVSSSSSSNYRWVMNWVYDTELPSVDSKGTPECGFVDSLSYGNATQNSIENGTAHDSGLNISSI